MSEHFAFLRNSDIFSHLISLKYLPRWVVLICDFLICFVSFLLAYLISSRFMYVSYDLITASFSVQLFIVLIVQVFFFWVFHTYSGVLRYSSYVDAAKLLFAVLLTIGIVSVGNLFYKIAFDQILFHYSTLVIYGAISFLTLFMLRMIVKIVYDFYVQNFSQVIPVMVYGTRTGGIGIAKMLRSTLNSKYKLVGFIEDEKDVCKKFIMGVKVYYLDDKTIKSIIVKKAKAVIVSPLKLSNTDSTKNLDLFLNNNLAVYTVPPMNIWDGDTPYIRQIKSIDIEDLLERPQIIISTDNIANQLKSKVVLVTGAAGSIGSEIVRQMSKYSPSLVVLLDQAESPLHNLRLELEEKYPNLNFSVFIGDVKNKERMEFLMNQFKPNYVYHAAAYKHVPLMEDNPVESIQTNVMGTKNMADLAVKYGVERFVMVSTDKAVNPTNVMGASKRIAEIYVQSLYNKLAAENNNSTTKFITTRFGNVLGSNGSVIPHFKKQIESGGPVTVTHPEILRYFMTIPEACMLVMEAGAMGEGGEIFIFDMGKPVKIVDLARKMIKLAGYTPDEDIKIVFTGLRPGEKLYEELLNNKEFTTETHNPKIMIASVQIYEHDEVSKQIDELMLYTNCCKDFLVVSQMKKIVPEFVSQNSMYEKLDIKGQNDVLKN